MTAQTLADSDPNPRVPGTRSGPVAALHVPGNVCAVMGGRLGYDADSGGWDVCGSDAEWCGRGAA